MQFNIPFDPIFDERLEAKIETYMYLFQHDGYLASESVKSVEDLKERIAALLYKNLRMELSFNGDFDTLNDHRLEGSVRYHVYTYFQDRFGK